MAFAGMVGADLNDAGKIEVPTDEARLFSESATRFLVEVQPDRAWGFEKHFEGLPLWKIGSTAKEPQPLSPAGRACAFGVSQL